VYALARKCQGAKGIEKKLIAHSSWLMGKNRELSAMSFL
jgi:hypothetical protein